MDPRQLFFLEYVKFIAVHWLFEQGRYSCPLKQLTYNSATKEEIVAEKRSKWLIFAQVSEEQGSNHYQLK